MALAIRACLQLPDNRSCPLGLVGDRLGEAFGIGDEQISPACMRYLRREVTADIGPKLTRMQLQLDTIEVALNLAIIRAVRTPLVCGCFNSEICHENSI